MGPADLPGYASVERIGGKPPDTRTADLAAVLVDELSDALGPRLEDGPAATAAQVAEAEGWRRWDAGAKGLETEPAAGGLLCRRRSDMSGEINVQIIPIAEGEIER